MISMQPGYVVTAVRSLLLLLLRLLLLLVLLLLPRFALPLCCVSVVFFTLSQQPLLP